MCQAVFKHFINVPLLFSDVTHGWIRAVLKTAIFTNVCIDLSVETPIGKHQKVVGIYMHVYIYMHTCMYVGVYTHILIV